MAGRPPPIPPGEPGHDPNIYGRAHMAATHASNRRRYRKKLQASGMEPALVEKLVAKRRDAQAAKRDELFGSLPPLKDDRAYLPDYVDPVLKGVARATGETAKAVKRGKTITKWQHDERMVSGD